MLDTFYGGLSRVARMLSWIGGALLIVAALTVTLEVLLRKIVSPVLGPQYTFTGSDEIASYLFAVATSLALSHVVMSRGNVRIDAVYRLFGPRMRAALDIFALLGLLLFALVLLERAWSVADLSYTDHIVSNTTLRVPLAIPQMAWFVGIAIFVLSILVTLASTLVALARGDLAGAARISGAISAEEEVSEELEGLGLGAHSRSATAAGGKGPQ